ncbi:hypothetical protein QLX08_004356 [Tetragonisca angustula]|uniref:Uncharacterized protein n=1 Tax=Tetragonisca angustula TaxID=166442 RepID=A0AAW1A5B7_9HYME
MPAAKTLRKAAITLPQKERLFHVQHRRLLQLTPSKKRGEQSRTRLPTERKPTVKKPWTWRNAGPRNLPSEDLIGQETTSATIAELHRVPDRPS